MWQVQFLGASGVPVANAVHGHFFDRIAADGVAAAHDLAVENRDKAGVAADNRAQYWSGFMHDRELRLRLSWPCRIPRAIPRRPRPQGHGQIEGGLLPTLIHLAESLRTPVL